MYKGFVFYFMSNAVAIVLSTTALAAEVPVEQKDTCSQEIQVLKQQLNILNEKVAVLETEQPTKPTTQPMTPNTNNQSGEKYKPTVSPGISYQAVTSNKENKTIPVSSGKAIYQKTCVACHGSNGKGISPSIPDFTKNGGVLSQPSHTLFNHIKEGIGAMPAKGGNLALTDQELQAALDFVESSFASEHKGAPSQTAQLTRQQPNNVNQKGVALNTTTTVQAPVNAMENKNQSQLPAGKSSEQLKSVPSYFWPNPDISGLMTGAVSAGYSVPNQASGSFNILDFNPLFLFRYKDLLFMQSSVDFALDDDGNTNVGLNTANLNLIVNDYMVFGVGEFDSPLGYFVQNLSPSWINRLPDAPAGFSSGQAAPQSELGTQLRGGFYALPTVKMNYIAFVANGPRAMTDSTTGLIDFIATDSFPNNYGNFIGGGRIGILPIPGLEIGFSGAGGKLALFDVNTNLSLGETGRNYQSLGADLSFKWKDWDFRGEVTQQQVGAQVNSMFEQSARWKAWYLQAAYWLPATKLQPIVRWGGYTSAVSGESQHQLALGVDYWFAPSLAAQVSFEINSGQSDPSINNNLFQIQLVFGF